MSQLTEDDIEEPVCAYAKKRGWLLRKASWIGRVGGPDRWFAKPGYGQLWVEFKAPGKAPEGAQAREIRRMREAGVVVHVIDNVAAGKALFD